MNLKIAFKDSFLIDCDTKIDIVDIIPELDKEFKFEESSYSLVNFNKFYSITQEQINELNKLYYITDTCILKDELIINYDYNHNI